MKQPRPDNRRQKMFAALGEALKLVENLDPATVTIKELDDLMSLAKMTVDVMDKGYEIRRALLARILASLVGSHFNLQPLDHNWSGTGEMPSVTFGSLIARIAQATASRIPQDESPIDDPFVAESVSVPAVILRTTFMERTRASGFTAAAENFA